MKDFSKNSYGTTSADWTAIMPGIEIMTIKGREAAFGGDNRWKVRIGSKKN